MAIVSDIEIRLMANIARLQEDMDRARQTVSSSMNQIRDSVNVATKALGALAVGFAANAFAGWIKGAIDATDAVSDISQRTGVAIKDIAGLQLWFQKGGTEAGAFEGAMVKLSKKIADGGTEFSKLGIKTRDSSGALRSNVDVLLDSADAFAAMQDGTAKTALAVDLFGKSGAELIPLLNEGSEGLREMNEMAEKLGLTFNETTVNAAGDFNDTLDFLGAASQGVARQVAAQLLPALNSLVGSFLTLVTEGNRVKGAADVIASGFKILYTVGVGVVQIFNTVGSTIGAAVGQLLAVLQGDFKLAAGIGKAWSQDMVATWSDSAKSIADVWNNAGGEVVTALAKTTNAGTVASNTASKDAKKQADAYQTLIDAIQGKITESDREAAGVAKLTESQKLAMTLDQGITSGKIKLTAAEEGYYRMLLEVLAASEDTARVNKEIEESNKRATKGAEDMAKWQKALGDEQAKAIERAVQEADEQEKLAAQFGLTRSAIAKLEVARLEEQLAQRASVGMTLDEIEHLEKLIDAKGRAAAAIAKTEDLEQQKALWTSIEETAHDTFISIANGGKDAATRLKDTFKNVFFDWLYQQTLKKWIINLEGNASLSNLGGMLGGGGGGSGGSGIMGTASNLLSIGKTIYSGFTTGLTSSLGSIITGIGETFGSAAVTSFGNGLFGGAGSALSGAAGAGASAASAIPIIGWIIAGMNAANGFFKQGFDIHNDSTKDPLGLGSGIRTVDNIFRGIGLSNTAANIFSGQAVFAKLFGRAAPRVESEGLLGSFDGRGFNSATFANILEKGGVFRSDSRYRAGQDSADEFDAGLTAVYNQIKAVTGGLAQTLGISTEKLGDFTKAFEITFDKDATKRQAQIEELFNGLGDDLATYLIPSIATFAQSGETASATLQRLAGEFGAVNGIFQSIGVDATKAFGAVGLASIDARTRLIALAGGVDALASQTQFFAQNFLTEAERMAPVQKLVTDQLTALGYAGVKTTDQFAGAIKDLIAGGGLTTEAGAKTYAALLALAPAFKTVTDYANSLVTVAPDLETAKTIANEKRGLEIQLLQEQGNTLGALALQREHELAAMNPANRALAERIYALQDEKRAVDALRTAAGDAFSMLRRSVDAERKDAQIAFDKLMAGLQESIDKTATRVSDLQSLSQALRGANVSGVADMQRPGRRAAADAQITAALAIARASGVLPKADDLKDALAAVAEDNADQFSSFVDYQRAQLLTANHIEELAGITDTELTVAQRTLASLEAQKTAAQAQFDAQMAKYDEMLAKAQEQLDAINGIGQVQPLLTAFNNFASSIADALGNKTIAGQPSVTGKTQIESLYNTLLGRTSDAAGLAYYLDLYNKGASLDNIAKDIKNSGEYANIYNPQQASATMAADQTTINERMQLSMERTAAAVEQLAEQFNNVSAGGNALATEVA